MTKSSKPTRDTTPKPRPSRGRSGKPPAAPVDTGAGTPATQGFHEAPQATFETGPGVAAKPRSTLPALRGAGALERSMETLTASLNALLARPQERSEKARQVLAQQPMLASHPLVSGSLPMFMPHRPPRPEKSEGGVPFNLVSEYEPKGDQPQAIGELVDGVSKLERNQVLLGVTGSGKTFTAAQVIQRTQRPALVLAPNKTLAAQLYGEFKSFFPDNAVEYFVSYYDYYQPEAYVARTDTYIEKETITNEDIDRLRHSAMQSILTRRDTLVVASVSCIYGLGAPEDYGQAVLKLRKGEMRKRDKVLRHLTDIYYERNDYDFKRGTFRVRGDTLEVHPAGLEIAIRIEFWGDEIEKITEVDPLTGTLLVERTSVEIFPAKYFVTSREQLLAALEDIEVELEQRVSELERQDKILEAARLRQRTNFDLEMLRETGVCSGVENYSRHMSRRAAGSRPWTLLDYFPDDFLLLVDESHMTVPQVRGMYFSDKARKDVLVEHGFRLPSALDNRPLMFPEFEERIYQAVFVSATPGPYENEHSEKVVEQVIRPTGLIDPEIEVKPTAGQIDDLIDQIGHRVARGERALVTTLTKRMAEDLADYLRDMGIKVQYLHSEIDTFERIDILRDLRLGVYDVVVGINLLREGLDLPEVSLVAILDADKEGYLRSESSLIQTIGRAARHVDGHVIMYADTMTGSMNRAIAETYRRRKIQIAYNEEHGIQPRGIQKAIRDISNRVKAVAEQAVEYATDGPATMPKEEIARLIQDLEVQMRQAAKNLNFEEAAAIRDQVVELKRLLVAEQPLVPEAWISKPAVPVTYQTTESAGRKSDGRPKSSRSGRSKGRR